MYVCVWVGVWRAAEDASALLVTASIRSNNADPTVALVDDVVTVRVESSETLASAPTVLVSGAATIQGEKGGKGRVGR